MAAGLKIERPSQCALFHAANGFVMRAVHWAQAHVTAEAMSSATDAGVTAVCGSVRLWAGDGVFSQESVYQNVCVRIGKLSSPNYPCKSCIICASKVITP